MTVRSGTLKVWPDLETVDGSCQSLTCGGATLSEERRILYEREMVVRQFYRIIQINIDSRNV